MAIVVAGAIANKQRHGGEAWVRLSWATGFRKLGFDVALVEEIARATCVDDQGRPATFRESANLACFDGAVSGSGAPLASALVLDEGEDIYGMTREELLELARDADLLVNVSGHLAWPELFHSFKQKAYVDIDPGFTQFWYAEGNPGARLSGHDVFFTIGENIGTGRCPIPTDGIDWRVTRQPVVLDDWPLTLTDAPDRFTTVASWRGSYGRVSYMGSTFGLKVHEFRKVAGLPLRSGRVFELALDIHDRDDEDRRMLEANGWRLVDPYVAAGDPAAFRRYVQDSGAEFSVAQGVYVETNSGWFSDRTTRYLASGKPVLVQDTGFSRNLPVGEGLVPFRMLDEAVAGARNIAEDYGRHARAARRIAEEHFDSDKVLGRFLEDALA